MGGRDNPPFVMRGRLGGYSGLDRRWATCRECVQVRFHVHYPPETVILLARATRLRYGVGGGSLASLDLSHVATFLLPSPLLGHGSSDETNLSCPAGRICEIGKFPGLGNQHLELSATRCWRVEAPCNSSLPHLLNKIRLYLSTSSPTTKELKSGNFQPSR